jgi:hypothetical protein
MRATPEGCIAIRLQKFSSNWKTLTDSNAGLLRGGNVHTEDCPDLLSEHY